MIETNNYYPQQRDGRIDAIEDGTPESVWVSEQLGAPVFKVFNGIFWKHLLEKRRAGAAPRAGSRCRSPATTRPASRSSPTWSTRSASTRSTPAPLAESWRQQPGTPVYGKDFDAEGVKKALAEASPERTEAFSLAA